MTSFYSKRGSAILLLSKFRQEREEKEKKMRHHHRNAGFTSGFGNSRREWGVYLVDGKYFVSTWTDLPHYSTDAIEKFTANGKRDALIKGEKIAEKHYEEQMKLPEDKRIKTIPKKHYYETSE